VTTNLMKMGIPTSARPVDRKKSGAPAELRVVLTGDRRVTENLILEVRAIAQRCGLEMPSVQVIRQPNVGAKTTKTKKVASNRKPRS
jgi:hypothetical protein